MDVFRARVLTTTPSICRACLLSAILPRTPIRRKQQGGPSELQFQQHRKAHTQSPRQRNNVVRNPAKANSSSGRREGGSKATTTKLSIPDHCFYWDTKPPTPTELSFARDIFKATSHSPNEWWASSKFRLIPPTDVPEVAFLGRANVGKSSLLNALMGKEICYTSAKPGRTVALQAYGVGGTIPRDAKVVLVDTPGYGKRANREWGEEIMKYLTKRKQLRRVFVLINAKHGLKSSDEQLLTLLQQNAIPHQIIVTKVDNLLQPPRRGEKQPELEKLHNFVISDLKPQVDTPPPYPGALGEILTCSVELDQDGERGLGIAALKCTILRAVGYAQPAIPDVLEIDKR